MPDPVQGGEELAGDPIAVPAPVPDPPSRLRLPAPESLTKASAALALICFVSGLLVVQSYLYSLGFGVGDLSVLKAQLVYTGADFLASIGFAVLCPLASWQLLVKAKNSKSTGSDGVVDSMGFIMAPILLVLPWIAYLVILGENYVRSTNFGTALKLYLLGAVAGVLILAAIFTAKTVSAHSDWAFVAVFGAMMVLGYLFWYASQFGTLLYPRIAQEYGGGRPIRAWLEAETVDKADALAELGVPFDKPTAPRRTKPLDLLYENKEVLVVRPDNGPIVKVQHNAVIAVRTDNRRPAAVSVDTTSSGRQPGVPEEGDVVTFRYSESLDTNSLLLGWDGSSTPVVVKVQSSRTPAASGGGGNIGVSTSGSHVLWVESAAGLVVAIGRVVDYSGEVAATAASGSLEFGTTDVPSTMTQNNGSIRIELGRPSRTWDAGRFGNRWRWEPSTTARDAAGYECRSAPIIFEPSKTRPPLF